MSDNLTNQPDIPAAAERTAKKTWQGMGSHQAPWFSAVDRRKPSGKATPAGSKGAAGPKPHANPKAAHKAMTGRTKARKISYPWAK